MVFFYILDTKTKTTDSSFKKPTTNIIKITINKLIKNLKKKILKIYSKKFIETLKNEDQLFYNNKKIRLYKTEMCRSFSETGYCKYKSSCQFCHSPSELRTVKRHPKYKTEICKTFWVEGSCPYGKRCCFAHKNQEKISNIKNQDSKDEKNKKINLLELTSNMTPFNMIINEKEIESYNLKLGTNKSISENKLNNEIKANNEIELNNITNENKFIKKISKTELDKMIDETELDKMIDETEIKKMIDETEIKKMIDETELDKMIDETEIKKMIDKTEINNLIDKTEINNVISEIELNKVLSNKILEKKYIINKNESKIPMPYKLAFPNNKKQFILKKTCKTVQIKSIKEELKINPIFSDLIETPEGIEKYKELQNEIFNKPYKYNGKFKPIFTESVYNVLLNIWDKKIWNDDFIISSEQYSNTIFFN